MKKICLALAVLFCLQSCMINTHTIGEGAKGEAKESKTMVYFIGNRLAKIDTKDMAKGEEDYDIKTEIGPLGVFLGFITFGLFQARTITVTK